MTYGVFNAVPAKPPMEPDTKLFMSCACGLCRNDKTFRSGSGQKSIARTSGFGSNDLT